MSRLSRIVAVLAVVAAACGGSSATVATVNGEPISLRDIADLHTASASSVTPEQLADDLTRLIINDAITQSLAAGFDYELSGDDVEVAMEELAQLVADSGQDLDVLLEERGLTEAGMRSFAYRDALITAIEQAVIGNPEGMRAIYEGAPAIGTTVCAHHILVSDPLMLGEAATRIDQGEDFETIADELSIDTASPGGDLGCSPASRYVPEFAEATVSAAIGEIVGPVQTQFGLHLIRVDSREVLPFEDIVAELSANRDASEYLPALLQEWVTIELRAADVVVEPEYGTWQIDPDIRVVAPADQP